MIETEFKQRVKEIIDHHLANRDMKWNNDDDHFSGGGGSFSGGGFTGTW